MSATTSPVPASPAPASPAPGGPAPGARPGRRLAGPVPASGAPEGAPEQAPGPLQRARARLRGFLEGTPGTLRLLGALAVAAALVFGVGAAVAFRSAHDAVQRAEANTAQLVRVQQIHTNLVRADAVATNAFLVGGLEPAGQLAAYDSSIDRASRLIAEAARSQPADAAALAELNAQLVAYSSLVERARANNRVGLPVGAQYLREASASVDRDSLPILRALATSNEERVLSEFDSSGRATWLLLLAGLLALGALGWVSWWLAQHTHRILNLPVVTAALALVVVLAAGLVGLAVTGGQVGETRSGDYSAALALAKARVAAFEAKSDESLTLISRGSGSAFEKAWQASAAVVTAEAKRAGDSGPELERAWSSYTEAHREVRALDDGGSWEQAVDLAVDAEAPDAPNQAFAAVDTGTERALTETTGAVTDRLAASRGWLPVGAVLAVLLSLAAAVLGWRGVATRLEEYR